VKVGTSYVPINVSFSPKVGPGLPGINRDTRIYLFCEVIFRHRYLFAIYHDQEDRYEGKGLGEHLDQQHREKTAASPLEAHPGEGIGGKRRKHRIDQCRAADDQDCIDVPTRERNHQSEIRFPPGADRGSSGNWARGGSGSAKSGSHRVEARPIRPISPGTAQTRLQ